MSRTYTNKRTYSRSSSVTCTIVKNKAKGKVTIKKLTLWQRIKKYTRNLFGTK
jgi:hypothetical protein